MARHKPVKIDYCELLGIDVTSYSEEVRKLLGEEMKKTARERVLSVHPYSLPTKEKWEEAEKEHKRLSTKIADPSSINGRKNLYAYSEDELFVLLYNHYFGENPYTIFNIFNKMVTHLSEANKVRTKTTKDMVFGFNRFIKNDKLACMDIRKISIAQMAEYLDRAHLIISDKDIANGQTVIEKHRHTEIRTILDHIYGYANTYMAANVQNPLLSLDYNSFPFYDQHYLTKPWYEEEERLALLHAFDSIKEPTEEELCTGFLLETAGRNCECRAMRFEDFHFNEKIPYVIISGMACNGYREERIKANSQAGKRALAITPRLANIYNLAKQKSWSDTFMFVQAYDKWNKVDDGILRSQGLQRGLKKICKMAGVKYLPPHQVRFSEATLMAIEGRAINEIQHRLGHTTPEMSNYYANNAKNLVPISGPYMLQNSAI